MKYRIPFGASRLELPVRLALRSGERLGRLLPGMETASALVVAESRDGAFRHSFHAMPLRSRQSAFEPDDGEWALYAAPAGEENWAYFLSLPPDFVRSLEADGRRLRSVSIQIVGHSPLREDASFAGHLTLEPDLSAGLSLLPRFARLAEEWLPELLPERFVAGAFVRRVDGGAGPRDVVFLPLLRREDPDLPAGMRPDFEPTHWSDAVLETAGSGPAAHAWIRGGCFLSSESGVSHWFGGRIGLDIPGFRERASRELLRHAPRGYAAWCFWMDAPGGEEGFAAIPDGTSMRVRHAALGWAWTGAEPSGSALGYARVMGMLADAARLRVQRHAQWERLLGEDNPLLWQAPSSPAAVESIAPLAAEVRDFYARHGGLLARLAAYRAAHPRESNLAFDPRSYLSGFAAAALREAEA